MYFTFIKEEVLLKQQHNYKFLAINIHEKNLRQLNYKLMKC